MCPVGFRLGQCSRKSRFLRGGNLAFERVAGWTDTASKGDLIYMSMQTCKENPEIFTCSAAPENLLAGPAQHPSPPPLHAHRIRPGGDRGLSSDSDQIS